MLILLIIEKKILFTGHTGIHTHPVCERRVNLLVYSLSLHRHSSIGFMLAFASSIHNKQHITLSNLFKTSRLLTSYLSLGVPVLDQPSVYEECRSLSFGL
jgi:hypothetical protein